MSSNTIRGTVGGTARQANPAFAGGVVLVAVVALALVIVLSVRGFGFLLPGECGCTPR